MDNWKLIKQLIQAKYPKLEVFARENGLSYNTLSGWISKNRPPRVDDAIKIAKGLGLTVEELFSPDLESLVEEREKDGSGLKSALKVIKLSEIGQQQFLVPLLNQRVSAGHGADLTENEEEQALIPAPAWLSRYGRDVAALMVTGDSMEPTLKNGDLVVCDTHGWEYDGVYVVQLGDQEYVKRVQKIPKLFRIISDNPKYPVMEEPAESQDLRIVGLVHCVVKMLE